jgi:hypothetical protein
MSKPDGGPAFPHSAPEGCAPNEGMTLRDWFAGMALQGLIASLAGKHVAISADKIRRKKGIPKNRMEWLVSKCSYDYADTMIAEREKQ